MGSGSVTVVYIDLLFLLNFAANYLLLLGAGRLAGAQLRRLRIAAGAALGFQAMLQQGTSIVGWAAIPIVVIPAFTIVASKVRKAK